MYQIEFSPAARRDLRKVVSRLQKPQARALKEAIMDLGEDPTPAGSTAMSDYPACFRIRVGRLRIVYQLKKKKLLVLVLGVGGRDKIYEELKRRMGR